MHRNAVDVLKRANGKDDYQKIASDLNMHPTQVSGLLKQAEKLGLAKKIGHVYKKMPGILRYVRRTNKNKNILKVRNVIQELNKPRIKQVDIDSLSLKSGIAVEAEKMATSYKWLYTTENVLRELIRKIFINEPDWWVKRVNNGIQKRVKDAIANYPYDGAKRKDELEYTHLSQLKEIIINNWDLFKSSLNEKNKDNFRATVDKALPYRNSIAHCTSLKLDDFNTAKIRFKDILDMLI